MFLVFAFNEFYPNGGRNDLVGLCKSKSEAFKLAWEQRRYDIVEIFEFNVTTGTLTEVPLFE